MKRILFFFVLIFIVQVVFAQNDNEKNVSIIKSLRAASNEAIAKHDLDGLSKYWLDDLVLVRGNSSHVSGKDSIVSAWRKLFKENPKVSYIRTHKEIIISSNDSLAWGKGTWKAINSYSG